MQKDVLPYPLALRMKRLGFNEMCAYFYEISTQSQTLKEGFNKNDLDWLRGDHCSAPTPAQCFKYFRDHHKIQGIIYSSTLRSDHTGICFADYVWEILELSLDNRIDYTIADKRDQGRDTYEEAELSCLSQLIELVELNSDKNG